MSPSKFWDLVEKHPWLIRVLSHFWYPSDFNTNPELVGDSLKPSAIKKEIH